jgi:hypothetical protein
MTNYKFIMSLKAILGISMGVCLLSGCNQKQAQQNQTANDREIEQRYSAGAAQQPSSNSIASNNVYSAGSEQKTAQDGHNPSSGAKNPAANP